MGRFSPEAYLGTNSRKVSSAGLSPQKISYIRDPCKRIVTGRLDLAPTGLGYYEEVVSQLDEVKEIGPWTAKMFFTFVLGGTNVLPLMTWDFQKSDSEGLQAPASSGEGKSREPG